MLKRFSPHAIAVAVALAWAAPAPAQQPKHAAGFLSEAFVRVTDLATKANTKLQYGYAKEANPSILAGWVKRGGRLEFTYRNLIGGGEYLFLADGDNDAEDVDVQVYSGTSTQGTPISQDVGTNRDAIVAFTPPANGNYTVKLTLAGSRNNVECACALVLMRKNGWNLPIGNLDKAMGQLTKSIETVDTDFRRNLNRRLDINKGDNQWAVFGGVVNAGEFIGVRDVSLGVGHRVFFGASDTFAQSLDLDVLDAGGRVLASQDPKSPALLPYLVREERNGVTPVRGVDLRNTRSNGAAIVMFAIADVR